MKYFIFFILFLITVPTYTLQKTIAKYTGPPCMMIGGFCTAFPASGGFCAEVAGDIDRHTAAKVCMCVGLCCFLCGGTMIDYAKKRNTIITSQPKSESFVNPSQNNKQNKVLYHPHSE